MYPFERFTERAKKTLTLAQEEAERSNHSYIGTEHLLLAILRNQDGVGYRVLEVLGVRIEVVRETIESVLGRNEKITIQQVVPTSRVKKVIELSFEEARRMGHDYVGTEHLLLGLMIEGEGIAARVLSDLGVTEAKVRDEVERQLRSGAVPEPTSRLPVPRPAAAPLVSELETLEALLATPPVAELLRARGLDVDQLIGQLQSPPEVVVNLRHHLSSLTDRLDRAVKEADYERATQFQRARAGMAETLRQAEQTWLNELTRPPDST
jgi:ATP-dependent Clp protease ATP-binding subunit ClpA